MSTSQNAIISVIHEYEILYTSRLTQKSKNWNDGKLKFYEFNRKFEIHNEEGYLIATDFYKSKSIESILGKILCQDNEFKLPNANFLIQIQGKLRDFEREVNLRAKSEDSQGTQKHGSLGVSRRPTQDMSYTSMTRNSPLNALTPKRKVVNARTLVIKDIPPPSKYQPVKRPVHATHPITKVVSDTMNRELVNSSTNSGNTLVAQSACRRVGLQRTPVPKLKSKNNNTVPEVLIQASLIAHQPVLKVTQPAKSKINKNVSIDFLEQAEFKIVKRSCIRILPKSSTHFQYLFTPTEQLNMDSLNTNSLAPTLGSLAVDKASTQTEVPESGDALDKESAENITVVNKLNSMDDDTEEEKEEEDDDEEKEDDDDDEYRIRILDDSDDEVEDDYDKIKEQEDFEELHQGINNEEQQEDSDYELLSSLNEISETIEPSQRKAIERKAIVHSPDNTYKSSNSENEILDSIHASEIPLKIEKPFIISEKTVEDADMIYDLSEIEQDERFNAMLEQMRKGQQSMIGSKNKRKRKQHDYNEAIEFNLSTDSEMEEI